MRGEDDNVSAQPNKKLQKKRAFSETLRWGRILLCLIFVGYLAIPKYAESVVQANSPRDLSMFAILVESVIIVDYGRYKTNVVALHPTENVSGNVTVQFDKIEHIETTKNISALIGEVFGWRIAYKNLTPNREYRVRSEVHHPPIKQPSGQVLTTEITERTMNADSEPISPRLWHFLKGYEYELVLGNWTMKEFIDDKEVASITFEIVK